MHEMSLISNLLSKIETIAQQQNADKVVAVKVRLGALAHISADHFREHFEQGTQGTVAAGARLAIDMSEDIHDPHAQDILLESVEVEA